jgi:competence ComEA-like helix-hairpin-helix protein
LVTRLDINTATLHEVASIGEPIGPKRSAAILQYRQMNGQFTSLMQLTNISGLGLKNALNLIGRIRMSVRDDRGSVMHYVAFSSDAYVNSSYMVTMPTGHIMLDTGCKRSVAGPTWHQQMRTRLSDLGLEPVQRACKAQFVFGSGKSVKATSSWVYPIAIRGRPALLDVAEVPCDCPGLMSKVSMKKMGMTYDLANETVDVKILKLKSVPVLSIDTGHPVINIGEFDSVDGDNYPHIFAVKTVSAKTGSVDQNSKKQESVESTATTKFRRNKLPAVSPDQYDSGPCLVEHNDWDHHHAVLQETIPSEIYITDTTTTAITVNNNNNNSTKSVLKSTHIPYLTPRPLPPLSHLKL